MTGNLALGATTASLWASDSLQKSTRPLNASAPASPEATALDEQFWYSVRGAFNLSPQFINFENGYFSPQPEAGIDEVCKNAPRHQRNPLVLHAGASWWTTPARCTNC